LQPLETTYSWYASLAAHAAPWRSLRAVSPESICMPMASWRSPPHASRKWPAIDSDTAAHKIYLVFKLFGLGNDWNIIFRLFLIKTKCQNFITFSKRKKLMFWFWFEFEIFVLKFIAPNLLCAIEMYFKTVTNPPKFICIIFKWVHLYNSKNKIEGYYVNSMLYELLSQYCTKNKENIFFMKGSWFLL